MDSNRRDSARPASSGRLRQMGRVRVARCLGCVVALVGLLAPAAASAFELGFGGRAWNDVRFAVDKDYLSGKRDFAFIRNESTLLFRLDASPEDRIFFVAEAELSFLGFSRVSSLEALTFRDNVDPFRIELNALYVQVIDFLGIPGLELKLGRQIIAWGRADKFNPTDWANPDDLEDPLVFGKNIANNMLRFDFAWDDYVLTAAVIPIFRPAQLPTSSLLALTDPSVTPVPSVRDGLGPLLDFLNDFTGDGEFGTLTVRPVPVLPETTLLNMQYAAKLAWRVHDFDVSVSFYHGFEDLPLPSRSKTTIGGVPNELDIVSEVEVRYVKFTSFGVDLAGNLSFLDDVGFWAEAAVFIPERLDLEIDNVQVAPSVLLPGEITPPVSTINVVRGVPFFKATLGADYTPVPWLYVNLQYVYGFIDEFGAGNLRHYVVGGTDIRFKDGQYILRLFAAWSLEETALVVFPSLLIYTFEGLELNAGAFLNFGPLESKFGSPAAGRSNVFLKGVLTF